MDSGLTEDDLKRIERFVERPRCRRRPEMLCPEADPDDEVTAEGET
jgi:hypothetical protein